MRFRTRLWLGALILRTSIQRFMKQQENSDFCSRHFTLFLRHFTFSCFGTKSNRSGRKMHAEFPETVSSSETTHLPSPPCSARLPCPLRPDPCLPPALPPCCPCPACLPLILAGLCAGRTPKSFHEMTDPSENRTNLHRPTGNFDIFHVLEGLGFGCKSGDGLEL